MKTRVLLLACMALAASARAEDKPPKWPVFAEALPEAEDRNVPLVVIVRKRSDEGRLKALADRRALGDVLGRGYSETSLDVADEKERAVAKERFGESVVAAAPVIVLTAPGAKPRMVDPNATTPEELKAAFDAVKKEAGPELMSSADYSNTLRAWRDAQAAAKAGDKKAELAQLDEVVWIQDFARVKKKVRFLPAAKKRWEELIAPVREQRAALEKAHEAKDWKKFWELVFVFMEDYRQLRLAKDVEKLVRPLFESKDKDALRGYQEAVLLREKPKEDEYRAKMAKVRAEALEALRAKVPASEVKDDDVTVAFWEAIPSWKWSQDGHTRTRQGEVAWLGGFWLGADRVLVFAWDAKAKKVVELARNADNEPASAVDFKATDETSKAVLELMRKYGRYEGRFVVPSKLEPTEQGGLRVLYLDGWDDGCGHLSFGWYDVDPKEKLLLDGGHVM